MQREGKDITVDAKYDNTSDTTNAYEGMHAESPEWICPLD